MGGFCPLYAPAPRLSKDRPGAVGMRGAAVACCWRYADARVSGGALGHRPLLCWWRVARPLADVGVDLAGDVGGP